MSAKARWVGLFVLVCLLTTAAVDFPTPASAQSRRALRRKKSHVESRIREIRKEIRNVKAEQATASNSQQGAGGAG